MYILNNTGNSERSSGDRDVINNRNNYYNIGEVMISIITPVHAKSMKYLRETHISLLDQINAPEWEWVLVPNAGGIVPEEVSTDPHVKIHPIEDDEDKTYNGIGRLKNFACAKASGSILVELDADDLLTPTALRTVHEAFGDPMVKMVYSNDAEFRDGTWESQAYSEYWGWRSKPFFWKGHELKEMIAWEPGPHMMRRVEWAPNHVRAWRRNSYWTVGGHDVKLRAGDDHDLCCRFYLAYGERGLKHIDECLYLYRVHGDNSCRLYNGDVQNVSLQNYLKYSRGMATRWARDNKLRTIDLGGRFDAWEGYETVDLLNASILADLNERWPFEDNSVGVIRASHIFEHLKDPVFTMNEAYRVLVGGGWLFVDVPSTDGRGAFQDPTHRSFWNENSFGYYTNRAHARYIQPQYKGRFQTSRVVTYFPSEEWERMNIPVVQADLICLKPPYSDRPAGEILI